MKTDFSAIDKYMEHHKTNKPPMVRVSGEEWANALDGYYNAVMDSIDKQTSVEEAWTLIYFASIAFCRGMEYAEVKSGNMSESNYPRY